VPCLAAPSALGVVELSCCGSGVLGRGLSFPQVTRGRSSVGRAPGLQLGRLERCADQRKRSSIVSENDEVMLCISPVAQTGARLEGVPTRCLPCGLPGDWLGSRPPNEHLHIESVLGGDSATGIDTRIWC
jgi:hypothetical protein